ncbi:MAG: bacillithiol biosynthesis BshC [Gemmatimonadaceae bacterium]|nr:bacillithiol biosynthesis BshC [Gemmatimonadaceae bacterium]
MSLPGSATGVVVRTVPLGGGSLSRAIQAGAAPAAWQLAWPRDRAAWTARAESVRATHDGAWLDALTEAFGSVDSPALARRRSAATRGVVVTTGQQPGLFGGPAYTITKALSALALADALEAALGIPVAPIFWAATDDADWREASVTHIVGEHGLVTLSQDGPPTDGIAMRDVPLGDVRRQLALLQASCGSVVAPEVLEQLAAAYAGECTVGGAYVQWLRAVLEPLGISVLDAAHPSTRRALDSGLRMALQSAARVDSALRARTAAISADGFTPQVELVDGLSLVFATIDGVRTRVPLADAVHMAASQPVGALGANVLLRPVLERQLLPTVAYVAGPGELAYFAQATAVADAMDVPLPLGVPRWAADWIEPQVARQLERLGVSDEELHDPHALETRVARGAMDRDVLDSLERLRMTLDAQVGALGHAVAQADALVAPTVMEGVARDIGHRIDRLERRLVAAVKRREQALARDVAVVRAARRPLGSAPERVLSLVPVLARHGLAVLDQFRDEAAHHARALVHGSTHQASVASDERAATERATSA